jgi:integrase/recombinase XerD
MDHYTIIDDFGKFLLQVLGVKENTKHQYSKYVQQFLHEKFDNFSEDQLAELSPVDVIRYMMNQKKIHNIPTLKAMTNAIRSFFRFLIFKGLCDDKIVSAVPAIADWKLAHIPEYLTQDQLEVFLSSFNLKKATGLRGYAIALCLSRLGLRRNEVANLLLDDIDWHSGIIRLSAGKGRKTDELPLPVDVGEAIVAYLKKGRPATPERRVFVRHCHPLGTAVTGSAISAVIRRAFKRAGLQPPSFGSHILRHTVASHMIQQGVSIKEVADILRHKSIDTTVIYTKVDIPMLSQVALPWPIDSGRVS